MHASSRPVIVPEIENQMNAVRVVLSPEFMVTDLAERLNSIQQKLVLLSQLLDSYVPEPVRSAPVRERPRYGDRPRNYSGLSLVR